SDESISASVGEDVTLNCSTRGKTRSRSRRTDSETLVHLYQDGESRPEAQQQDYYDRANFFTDQIQHGNFSLCLDNLRAEDEGRYTCRVYSQQDSVFLAKKNLVPRLYNDTGIQNKNQSATKSTISGNHCSYLALGLQI
uniref:Ig-like domain-containing protein n=1 Tax=Sinocyclocheilus rhinocerous TaxID=307959 RepID=A0A673HRQ4_9TELE